MNKQLELFLRAINSEKIRSNPMWMVRAGSGNELIERFKNENVVCIGWSEVGDLTKIKDYEELKENVRENWQDYSKGKLINVAGQLERFKSEIKVGDYVITYEKELRTYYVGNISSECLFSEKKSYAHYRKVQWLGNVNRDSLSVGTKNTLGSTLTLFEIKGAEEKEILSKLNEPQAKITVSAEQEEKGTELEIIKDDFIEKSNEFIKDKLIKLDWEDMQNLVAGILRSMGYKTRVSPKGADRGRDIQASPDGLGLEQPRIMVEVKHRSGQMGTKEIRSFLGGLRHGDLGLYVSTGGFSKEAKYEAERSNIPITLIDIDELVKLLTEYYNNIDTETRALVPLRKIYWPMN